MKGNRKRTPALVAKVRRLRDEGLSFNAIGERIGVSDCTIACWLDGARWEKRKARQRLDNARRRAAGVIADDRQERQERPLPKPDARSLTGRLCGDPPAGRSALDKRGGA